jgi:hypothetical protein
MRKAEASRKCHAIIISWSICLSGRLDLAAEIAADKKGSLFRAIRKGNKPTENPMAREPVAVGRSDVR